MTKSFGIGGAAWHPGVTGHLAMAHSLAWYYSQVQLPPARPSLPALRTAPLGLPMRGPARPLPSGSAAPARPPNLPALRLQLLDAAAAALERQALSAASAPEAFGAWSLKAALPLERKPLRAPVLCDRAAEVRCCVALLPAVVGARAQAPGSA